MCLNHQTDLVCFDCCVCLIAIPRMSSWAYAPREDLDAWNSKRVLSSPPALAPHFRWNFANIRSRSVCCCIKMKSFPPTCRPPPTPTFPWLSSPTIVSLSLQPLLMLWTKFLGFILYFLPFSPLHVSPHFSPLLRGCFWIGGCEREREGACFPLEVKTALDPAGARPPSSCLRLSSWSSYFPLQAKSTSYNPFMQFTL